MSVKMTISENRIANGIHNKPVLGPPIQTMLKTVFIALLPFLVFFGDGTNQSLTGLGSVQRDANSGILKKMIVAQGSVVLNLDSSLTGRGALKSGETIPMRFDVDQDSFFTVLVMNEMLRGPIPSSMNIDPTDSKLPASMGAQLSIESLAPTEPYELAVRDPKTGFTYFYVEGHLYDYNPQDETMYVQMGRLILSREYAEKLGRPSDAMSTAGQISISAKMRSIEVSTIVDGDVKEVSMPADQLNGTVPGPDVVVGDLSGLAQFGSSSGTQVGLAVGTDSCNFGTVNLNWIANPANDHPVIPQNLYRMSGGPSNTDRFEQIGQSSVKHAFTALTNNICSLGCNGVGGSQLGSGCSDPYSASLNSGPNLGSRAWINPYTGAYPRNDSATPNNNHTGHTHLGPSHRILTEIADLNTSLNSGATYYAEGQYITPHEYVWCQSNPGQCNMNNNVSYRQYSVSGTTSPFSFSPVTSTQRQKAAIIAWTGATLVPIEPAPGADGIGVVAYKVTNPSPGVWHYEYAIYNQNIDRAIQSFSVPTGAGVSISNIGFHMPPQHPGWANDGTVGSAGFSSTPWSGVEAAGSLTWSSETFAQNQNANAIRWGTLYNFRFDSNQPPTTVNATLGFFKTGSPMSVQIQGPASAVSVPASVSGRVMASATQGSYLTRVVITDGNGFTLRTTTNPFGYFRFNGVPTGATYTVSVQSKAADYAPQNVPVSDNVTGLLFQPAP